MQQEKSAFPGTATGLTTLCCPKPAPIPPGTHKIQASEFAESQEGDGVSYQPDLSHGDAEQVSFSSVCQLQFKAKLLELIEELKMRRETQQNLEQQINNLVAEKQELEWKNDAFTSKCDSLKTEHSKTVTKLNRQFESKLEVLREEKNKCQFMIDASEKEMTVMKEKLKTLNFTNYTLEKQLTEQKHKIQLQTHGKESVLNQLAEVCKIHGQVMKQCRIYKEDYDKLKINVQGFLKLNKKLQYANRHNECVQADLKQKINMITEEILQANVAIHVKHDQQQMEMTEKVHELQDTKNKLLEQIEINKKLNQEITIFQNENQNSLKCLCEAHHIIAEQCSNIQRTKEEFKIANETHQELENKLNAQMLSEQNKNKLLTELQQNWEEEKSAYNKKEMALEKEVEYLNDKCQTTQEKLEHVEEQNIKLKAQLAIHDKLDQNPKDRIAQIEAAGSKIPSRSEEQSGESPTFIKAEEHFPCRETYVQETTVCNKGDANPGEEGLQSNVTITACVDSNNSTESNLVQQGALQNNEQGNCLQVLLHNKENKDRYLNEESSTVLINDPNQHNKDSESSETRATRQESINMTMIVSDKSQTSGNVIVGVVESTSKVHSVLAERAAIQDESAMTSSTGNMLAKSRNKVSFQVILQEKPSDEARESIILDADSNSVSEQNCQSTESAESMHTSCVSATETSNDGRTESSSSTVQLERKYSSDSQIVVSSQTIALSSAFISKSFSNILDHSTSKEQQEDLPKNTQDDTGRGANSAALHFEDGESVITTQLSKEASKMCVEIDNGTSGSKFFNENQLSHFNADTIIKSSDLSTTLDSGKSGPSEDKMATLFPDNAMALGKRKRDYSEEWNAIAEVFDTQCSAFSHKCRSMHLQICRQKSWLTPSPSQDCVGPIKNNILTLWRVSPSL
uniref:Coiled-coil domain-containing protein 73 n=1 Tax=Eptatretus burgeri TaxID=7764 RepID=A0A8C4NDU8_EPTBU